MPRTADDPWGIATSVGATGAREEAIRLGRPPQAQPGPFQNGFVVAVKS